MYILDTAVETRDSNLKFDQFDHRPLRPKIDLWAGKAMGTWERLQSAACDLIPRCIPTPSPTQFLGTSLMDSDRKSTVSSFYGARKPSVDALNQDYPPQPMVGGRRDDASSFFSPDRSSMDHLNGPRTGSAGYNRGSFFHTGREEPLKGGRDEEIPAEADAWDVYADFNNTGPRYSSAFGMGQGQPAYVFTQ